MWHFVHLTHIECGLEKDAIMMAPQFSRPLQTALDNTQGALRRKTVVFEPTRKSQAPQDNIVGHVSIVRQMGRTPVYDAGKFGPDISLLPQDQQVIWVRVNSVLGKDTKVVWPVNIPELFAMWDYERVGIRMINKLFWLNVSTLPRKDAQVSCLYRRRNSATG